MATWHATVRGVEGDRWRLRPTGCDDEREQRPPVPHVRNTHIHSRALRETEARQATPQRIFRTVINRRSRRPAEGWSPYPEGGASVVSWSPPSRTSTLVATILRAANGKVGILLSKSWDPDKVTLKRGSGAPPAPPTYLPRGGCGALQWLPTYAQEG